MKKIFILLIFSGFVFIINDSLKGQEEENCFLKDFELKEAVIPSYENYERPTSIPTVTVTIDFTDTISRVTKYIFGNAVAVWVYPDVNNPVMVSYLQKLSPTLIRFPGGTWSDIYFWNGNPGDIPVYIPDGQNNGSPVQLYPKFGPNQQPTFNSYLNLREQVNAQGLVTINYGYARYGLGEDPVARAAHLAADWVRADNGHTRFWEIGNESAGPWEPGWQIDTELNQDGQPEIINGETYGKHFKVFSDSMRKAAAEVGTEIYIGAQIIQYDATNSWNVADRGWNEAVYREAGDVADFYVIHNYFGGNSSNPKSYLTNALKSINDMIDFIHQDFINFGAEKKPVALTEWNVDISNGGEVRPSIINGMQAVLAFSEMAKLGYSMSCRWLIANWDTDGMFYHGNNSSIPEWNPRPAFFYTYYLQKHFGSYILESAVSGSDDILTYASVFNSGEIGIILVNMGSTDQTIGLDLENINYGDRYYYYSLEGGTDDEDYSKYVYVNGAGPEDTRWGPIENLENINARSDTLAYPVKIYSPKRSVQYILLETGNNTFTQVDVDSFYISTKNNMTSITEDNGTLTVLSHFIPQNATNNAVIWSVSDETVATINSIGIVKAMSNGQVTVTATSVEGSFTDTVNITVTNQGFEVTGVSLTTETGSKTIETLGGTLQIIAVIEPENADDKTVTWEVNDTAIASINEDGLLTAKADGRVTVRVYTNDGNYTASIVITIKGQTIGINDISLSGFKVYPVPAEDMIYIENSSFVLRYEILNIEGKLLSVYDNPGLRIAIDISDFQKGIYFVRVQTETNIKVIKFIK